jgi:hypothetical protein
VSFIADLSNHPLSLALEDVSQEKTPLVRVTIIHEEDGTMASMALDVAQVFSLWKALGAWLNGDIAQLSNDGGTYGPTGKPAYE